MPKTSFYKRETTPVLLLCLRLPFYYEEILEEGDYSSLITMPKTSFYKRETTPVLLLCLRLDFRREGLLQSYYYA